MVLPGKPSAALPVWGWDTHCGAHKVSESNQTVKVWLTYSSCLENAARQLLKYSLACRPEEEACTPGQLSGGQSGGVQDGTGPLPKV